VPDPQADRSLYVRLGPVADGGIPPQRNAQQLGTHIESLAVAETSLYRFVDTVCELADVAVTLDPFELELAGVTPRRMVGIDAKDATIEQVLRDVFTKLRLDLVERDGQFGIELAGGDARREITYDVADLAGQQEATPIADLVQRFVAPNSWTDAGGGGSIKVEKSRLRIEQSQRVRHELLIFCERLRLARGLSQRSRYPAALLATVSPYEAAAQALRQRATFTLLPWTRLSDAVRHWQDANKLTLLVDWRALADMELGPSTPVTCSAIDQTWEDALDGILEPIGLAWWAVNGETIQITSREAMDEIQKVEFYAVPPALRDQFATAEDLVKSLQDELAELAAKARATPQPPTMELDEPSGRLIVLATPVSHRRLTQLLIRGAKQVASQAR
jgi:hypothetical protein